MAVRILLKTTIPFSTDDWHVGRFSLLARHLGSLTGAAGKRLYDVSVANRVAPTPAGDSDLEAAAHGAFDQVWLIATDAVNALTGQDVSNLQAVRELGGGLFVTRDHQDLGACLTRLGSIGLTQHFQTVNPEADEARRCPDDTETPAITWPNYHSGRNGDLQLVKAVEPLHPVMRARTGVPIARLPAHPHEGTVSAPSSLGPQARVIATGRSKLTGKPFNLCVAVEEANLGRALSDSSFHHLADYNWDTRMSCPTFVTEPSGDEVINDPHALDDVHDYVANAAAWLAGNR